MNWFTNAAEYTYDAVASTVPATSAAIDAFGTAWSKDMERRALERAAEAIAARKMREMKDAMIAEANAKINQVAATPSTQSVVLSA